MICPHCGKETIPKADKRSLPDLIKIACLILDDEYFPITYEKLIGKRRDAYIVKARVILSSFLHSNGFTLTSIGKEMNRDHTTILYHCKQYENFKHEPEYYEVYDLLQEHIK